MELLHVSCPLSLLVPGRKGISPLAGSVWLPVRATPVPHTLRLIASSLAVWPRKECREASEDGASSHKVCSFTGVSWVVADSVHCLIPVSDIGCLQCERGVFS